MDWYGIDSSSLAWGEVVGFCEHGQEASGFIKWEGFLD